jgi:hypothetical protein
MSTDVEKSRLQQTCEIAGILTVPIFAFLLGRYSVAFSGSALEWFTVACYSLVLPFVLCLQLREKIGVNSPN